MDGFGGVTRQKEGQEVLHHLGYPMYALSIFGAAKLLGVIALAQDKYKVIKEWAFAGFTFNFIGAFMSRVFVGDGAGETIFPLIVLALFMMLYFYWKKYQQVKNVRTTTEIPALAI
jgi:hypothetical protein